MSPIRMLNALLLIAAVIGGVLTYRASQTHQPLLAEQKRLEQKVGTLRIEDPSKMHVRALETGEPLHFTWRVYLPVGSTVLRREDGRARFGWPIREPREFMLRVRFREDDDGVLRVFTQRTNGSGTSELGSRQLADLLRDRWDEIQVEQLGRDHLVVVEPDEVPILLRLTLSEELRREAEQKLSQREWKRFQTELFGYRIGSDKAFQRAAANQSSANR